MDRVRAPYNFVPLSPEVCLAKDLSRALIGAHLACVHDVPFRDGIDAELDVTVAAETPIFIRGGGDGGVSRFFTAADGTPGIPGSSLRGALRNALEIASFARMTRVNDHVYGVRDLHNRTLYGDHMAEIIPAPGTGKGVPTPLVTAGWLRRLWPPVPDGDEEDPVVAEIVPCNFFKVHYRDVMALATARGMSGFDPGRKQAAADKYAAWKGPRDVSVEVTVTRPRGGMSKAAKVPFLGDFGLVRAKGLPVEGALVFTGQPSEWNDRMAPKARGAGNPKQHDFVFHPRPEAIPAGDVVRFRVRRSQFEDFEFIHRDAGQQGRDAVTPNAEWGHWRPAYLRGEHVPVFVLPHPDGTLRSFGLAMMFRLAYKLSVGDAVRNGQPGPDMNSLDDVDVAEAIFGTVPLDAKRDDDERSRSLKGRVSFGFARLTSKTPALKEVSAVLGAPKATFYPSYVEQAADPVASPAAQPRGSYRTLMDDGAVVRGWKRYRPHPTAVLNPPIPAKSKESVRTRFAPLDRGATFEGKLRLHNLLPEELGAIVWVSHFGGDAKARHTLGMARPLGYGRVTITLKAAKGLVTHGGEALTLVACEERFVAAMNGWAQRRGIAGGWAQSEGIRQLIACAWPAASLEEVRSMQLDHPEHKNEFVAARKSMLSLAPAAPTVTLKATNAPTAKRAARRGHAKAALRGAVRLPGVGAPTAGPGEPTADPVPPVASAAPIEGTIARYANNQVRVTLADKRTVDVAVSTDVFVGFKALNGNELRRDRPVLVELTGTKVTKVRPRVT